MWDCFWIDDTYVPILTAFFVHFLSAIDGKLSSPIVSKKAFAPSMVAMAFSLSCLNFGLRFERMYWVYTSLFCCMPYVPMCTKQKTAELTDPSKWTNNPCRDVLC